MHKFSLLSFATLIAGALSLSLAAQEPPAPKTITDQAEVAFVDTSGNTDVTSLAAKNTLTWNISPATTLGWKVAALQAQTDGETTAESYGTDLRLQHLLNERLYVFGVAGWAADEFAGFDSRANAGVGAGYKVFTGPKHLLSLEGGIDYVAEEYTNGTDDSFAAARAFGLYEYLFSEKNKFGQSLEVIANVEDADAHRLRSETYIQAGLTGALSMKASYNVRYNNAPVPASLEKTDTVLAVSLVASF